MQIKILQAAKEDLHEGFEFYEAQKRGVGQYFLTQIFSDIESLQSFAGVHIVCFGQYYRLLVKKFPFAIYYRIFDAQIRIYAVIDCRRSPAWIRNKLS